MERKTIPIVILLIMVALITSCSDDTTTSPALVVIPDFEMIFVEGGHFCPIPNDSLTTVFVSSFYIGNLLVTQDRYLKVMGKNPSHFENRPNNPVERVSWYDAVEFCNRLSIQEGLSPCYTYTGYGSNPDDWPANWNADDDNHTLITCDWSKTGYRLPTELEWMYAAVARDTVSTYNYSGSNEIRDVAWYIENSDNQTHAVGQKNPNNLNIYDMSGNVWEWCWDIWEINYPFDHNDDVIDHKGADTGEYRVLRGGSWAHTPTNCTVYHRGNGYASEKDKNFGLRIVRGSF